MVVIIVKNQKFNIYIFFIDFLIFCFFFFYIFKSLKNKGAKINWERGINVKKGNGGACSEEELKRTKKAYHKSKNSKTQVELEVFMPRFLQNKLVVY